MKRLSLTVIVFLALGAAAYSQSNSGASGTKSPRSESATDRLDASRDGLGVGRERVGTQTPANLDFSTTRLSTNGLFRVSFKSEADPIPRRQLHDWTITVQAASGESVDGATILVGGGMPQHGHGLPTEPAVTKSLGSGKYLIEGMKFNMGGWWEVRIKVLAGDKIDLVVFNLSL